MFFVALCTYSPRLDYLSEQIDSIRNQSVSEFRCLIQDDASPLELIEQVRRLVVDDPRFTVRRNPQRLGVSHNFEQALRQVPNEAQLICYCRRGDSAPPSSLGARTLPRRAQGDQRLTRGAGSRLRSN